MRISDYTIRGQDVHIIHLGDHDPSGIDMTRDIEDRIGKVFGASVSVNRIALNMDQVQQYAPPPNPAKVTDSRFEDYLAAFGPESWELDALDPSALVALIEHAVKDKMDPDLWQEKVDEEIQHLENLEAIRDNFDAVTSYVKGI